MTYLKKLESKFEEWLKKDEKKWKTKESRASYLSGMRSLVSWLNEADNHDLWNTVGNTKFKSFEYYLKRINNNDDLKTFFSAVHNIIKKSIKQSSFIATLQNYNSYLSAYKEFYNYYVRKNGFPTTDKIPQSQMDLLKRNSSFAKYTKKELIDEFSGRITTQDRISLSKEVLFPVRLIKRLWPEKTNEWAEEVCKKIYLILKGDSDLIFEKKLENIEELCINNDGAINVKVENDEMVYTLLTSYSDPYENLRVDINDNNSAINILIQYIRKRSKTDLCRGNIPQKGFIIDKNQNIRNLDKPNEVLLWHVKQMKVRSIGDIAIDHDIPISLVLSADSKKLSQLRTISELYRKFSENYGLPVTAANANKFNKQLFLDINKKDKEEIKNVGFPKESMDEIAKCKLVLMGKSENSLKSDN